MAFTKVTTSTALAGVLVTSTNATALANPNVTGSTSGRIYQVQIDNTENTVTSYLKIFDSASATPGSSIPILTLPANAGKKVTYAINTGLAYASGVCFWCTTGAEVASTQSPNSPVPVVILAS